MHSQFVPGGNQIDLTNCDREPIHTPGSVQSYGAIIAVDPATERILATSENIGAFIGTPAPQAINALIADVLGTAAADAFRAAIAVTGSERRPIALPLARRDLTTVVHRFRDTIYLEIEPHEGDTEAGALAAPTRDAVRTLTAIDDVEDLCARGAATLRALTGYDRVMIYRFDPDGHGHVIAEARDEQLEAYLGRHYPASDIPRQARALYKTTMLRLIVDVNAPGAPIEPPRDPRTAAEWDLSGAVLRTSSPIHLEYLRNMGVTATMTVSLLREGELWGLIAAHHYQPKFISSVVRYAVETVGHALVGRIVQLEDARIATARLAARDAVLAFMLRVGAGSVEALVNDIALHAAIGIDGVAYVNGSASTTGRVPNADRIAALIAWLDERAGSDSFVTDALAKLNPAFADDAEHASGVFAARHANGWFFAFRGEEVQTVDWGGDPTKPAQSDGERLSPRGSFALWREEVHQRALPWEPWTLEALQAALAWSASAAT